MKKKKPFLLEMLAEVQTLLGGKHGDVFDGKNYENTFQFGCRYSNVFWDCEKFEPHGLAPFQFSVSKTTNCNRTIRIQSGLSDTSAIRGFFTLN